MDLGPAHVSDLMHGVGYAFQEDFFAVDNTMEEAPEVVNVHNVLAEDFLFANGYADGFLGNHPMNVMF